MSIADTALLGRAGNSTPTVPVTANLILHLDANAITGKNDGDTVSTWSDTSGNGNNFSNAGAASLHPVYRVNLQNGRPGLDFDGTDDYLTRSGTMSAATVYSLFVVMRADSTAGTPVIFRTGDTTGGVGFLFSAGANREILHRAVAAMDDGAGTTNAEYWSAVKTAVPLTTFSVNGVNQAITNSGSSMNAMDYSGFVGVFNTGLGLYFNGRVFEILYYDTNLSGGDRTLVEAYLAAKWGI